MTFSIVARSADGESWGIAVASKFLAVGNVVPAAVAGIGAIATQADANVAYKAEALSMLDEGATAEVTLARLLEDDDGRDHRQVGLVDVEGNAVTHTGSACFDWAGGVTADGVAIQGNILTGREVVDEMLAAWESAVDEPSLARRLVTALLAGDRAGGDRRGRQSAAVFVVREGGGYAGGDDVAVDLRVDDHPDPCPELPAAPGAQRPVPHGVPGGREGAGDRRPPSRDRGASRLARSPRRPRVGRVGELRDARRHRREPRVDRPTGAGHPSFLRCLVLGCAVMSILAIDAGTTGVTAVIVTADGTIAAKGYQEFPQHFPRPGWVEHSPEEIWQATLESTRAALAAYDGDAR